MGPIPGALVRVVRTDRDEKGEVMGDWVRGGAAHQMRVQGRARIAMVRRSNDEGGKDFIESISSLEFLKVRGYMSVKEVQ